MAILLISEDVLKRYSPIEGNVDIELIKPHLFNAQETVLHESLGTDLLREIQDEVENATLTADNTTLLNDYIRPIIAYEGTYMAMPFLRGRIRNGDIVTRTSDDAQPVSEQAYHDMRNSLKHSANWYTQRMISFLCDNSDLYPTYSTNEGSDVKPKSSGYNCGLVI